MIRRGVALGSSALVLAGAALLVVPGVRAHVWSAWLGAFTAALSVVFGALIWVQIAHLTGAAWLAPVRRLFEHLARAMPAVGAAAIPLAWRSGRWLVTVVTLALFVALAELLSAWSRRADGARDLVLFERQRVLSAAALPAAALAFTLLVFELVMPIDRGFRSTVFALVVFAGGAAAALSAGIAGALLGAKRGALTAMRDHFFSLGKMLLAFVVFWAYVSFAQFLLVWIANIPAEAAFYVVRLEAPWAAIGLVILIGHFVVPAAALLSWRFKRSPGWLVAVAALLLVMHVLDAAWLTVPTFRPEGPFPTLADLAAASIVLGSVALVAALRATGALVARDPTQERALAWEDA